VIAVIGIAAGAVGGYALAAGGGTILRDRADAGRSAGAGCRSRPDRRGGRASLMPAARASHVDVVQALRSE
jgi:hypothetical protein